jgi:peptidyl-prolyl cis-trans isomerase SurA
MRQYHLRILFILCGIWLSIASQAQTTDQATFNQKESLAKARIIFKRLRQGEDFEKMARAYSNDPGSARVGGNLGIAKPGQMIDAFEKAALSLKEGEISKPVKSEFGYHIIQLLEKNSDGYKSRHILIRIE